MFPSRDQQIDEVEFDSEPEVDFEPFDEEWDVTGNPVGEVTFELPPRSH